MLWHNMSCLRVWRERGLTSECLGCGCCWDEQLDACRMVLAVDVSSRAFVFGAGDGRRVMGGPGASWLVGVAYCVGGWVGVVWGKGCENT